MTTQIDIAILVGASLCHHTAPRVEFTCSRIYFPKHLQSFNDSKSVGLHVNASKAFWLCRQILLCMLLCFSERDNTCMWVHSESPITGVHSGNGAAQIWGALNVEFDNPFAGQILQI